MRKPRQTYIDTRRAFKSYHRVWLVSGGNFSQDYPLPSEWQNIT